MGVSIQEDGPKFKVGCPGERLVNVALHDGVPSQARQLRDDWHLTASRHPGQEAVDISQSLSTVQAPFKRRARWFGRGAGFAACGLYRQNALTMADSVNGAPWHSRLPRPSVSEAAGVFGNARFALESRQWCRYARHLARLATADGAPSGSARNRAARLGNRIIRS